MKKTILTLAVALLAVFTSWAQGPADTVFTLVAEWNTTAQLTDSTFSVSANHPADQLGQGFLPTQIQVGYRGFDAFGRLFEITAVGSADFGSSTLTVKELQDNNTGPGGVGLVYRPLDSGLIPVPPGGNTGLAPATLARLHIHNVANGGAGGTTTEVLEDSILVFKLYGSEVGRDTIRVNLANYYTQSETDAAIAAGDFWTESGGGIYRNSEVAINRTTFQTNQALSITTGNEGAGVYIDGSSPTISFGNKSLIGGPTNTGRFFSSATSGDLAIRASSGKHVLIGSNGDDMALSIDDNNRVGINAYSPSYVLDIQGAGAALRLNPNDVAHVDNAGLLYYDLSQGHFVAGTGAGLEEIPYSSEIIPLADLPSANRVLYSDGSTIAGDDGLVYDPTTGNLGLGDTTPDWPIEVIDSTAIVIPVGPRPQSLPTSAVRIPQNGAIRVDTVSGGVQYGYVPNGLDADDYGRWVTLDSTVNRVFEYNGKLYFGHYEEAPLLQEELVYKNNNNLNITYRYWESREIKFDLADYSVSEANAYFLNPGVLGVIWSPDNSGNLSTQYSRAVYWGYFNESDSTYTNKIGGVTYGWGVWYWPDGSPSTTAPDKHDSNVEIIIVPELDSAFFTVTLRSNDSIWKSGAYAIPTDIDFEELDLRVRAPRGESSGDGRFIRLREINRFTSLSTVDLAEVITAQQANLPFWTADSLAASYGQSFYVSDQDSTLSIDGYSVAVRAAISASPGQEFTLTLPAASSDLAGRTVTIVETDANTSDFFYYNIVPAAGNFYRSDGGSLGTTTMTNETKVFRCLPVDGSSWAWHLLEPEEKFAEMYIPASDPDTISITSGTPAEGTDWSVEGLAGFTYSAGRLTYSGPTQKFLLSTSVSCEYSVSNTQIYSWLYLNGAAVDKTLANRKIGTAGDIGNFGQTAILTLSNGDYLELFFDADTNGTLILDSANLNVIKI